MTNRFSELRLNFQRVAAVDGRSLQSDALEKWTSIRFPDFGMGPGEIACFLSHRKAWECFIDSEKEWCFIAEDDAHLSSQLTSLIQSSRWIPSDAQIIKGETTRQRVWLGRRALEAARGYQLRRLLSNHGGSAGYFIRRDAARFMLDKSSSICTIPDQLMFNPRVGLADSLVIYQIDPAIVIQDWLVDQSSGSANFESLLLQERDEIHGKTARLSRGFAGFLARKAIGPFGKLSRRIGEHSANILRTHSVKKVSFSDLDLATTEDRC